jgi:hypothetical protein
MRTSSSARATGLPRISLLPLSSARTRSSVRSREVTMITGVRAISGSALMAATVAKPSSSGIMASSRTRSGRRSRSSRSPSRPFSALRIEYHEGPQQPGQQMPGAAVVVNHEDGWVWAVMCLLRSVDAVLKKGPGSASPDDAPCPARETGLPPGRGSNPAPGSDFFAFLRILYAAGGAIFPRAAPSKIRHRSS